MRLKLKDGYTMEPGPFFINIIRNDHIMVCFDPRELKMRVTSYMDRYGHCAGAMVHAKPEDWSQIAHRWFCLHGCESPWVVVDEVPA